MERTHRTSACIRYQVIGRTIVQQQRPKKRRMHDYPSSKPNRNAYVRNACNAPRHCICSWRTKQVQFQILDMHIGIKLYIPYRYLVGTKDYGLFFDGNSLDDLSSLILSYNRLRLGRKHRHMSFDGWTMYFSCAAQLSAGVANSNHHPHSRQQRPNTCLYSCCSEAIWLRQLLEQLGSNKQSQQVF